MLSKREQQRLQQLIRKYLDGKASPKEAAFIETWYAHFDQVEDTIDMEQQAREDRMLHNLLARIDEGSAIALPSRRIVPLFRIGVAAALLLMIVGAWLLYRQPAARKQAAPVVINDVAPGGNKATLTLGNGQVISLDSAADGKLAEQGQAAIVKLKGGQVAYQPTGKGDAAITYNTLATPLGGQYKLTLPDGTMVWLNSTSSISYPTRFTGSERRVTITGEAYFEVKENRQMPFRVDTRDVSVAVLGTHFDVMAYADEPSVNTTLVEGKVKVLTIGASTVLQPGQQAVVKDRRVTVREVDTDKEIAWTTGFFEFDQTDLPTLMRQLQRWYGVEAVYQSDGGGRLFDGRISRSLKLSEVLDLLQSNGIHFTIENKKLIVLP